MRQSACRILPVFLLLVLLWGLSTARAETIAFSVASGTPGLDTDPDGSTRLDLAGCSLAGAVGNPLLPFREVDVLLPPDADPASLNLTVTKADTRTLPGRHVLAPQAASSESGAAALAATTGNAAVYGRDALFPHVPASLLRSSRMRKWRFARVAVQPVQYNPVSGALVANTRLDLELRYKRTGATLAPAEARDTVMEREAAARFVNYQTGKDWYAPAVDSRRAAADPEGRHDYVIITTKTIRENSTALGSFLASLVRRGHTPYVKDVEDIFGQVANEPAPHGRAEKIRQWLADHFQTMGIAYVLLIGNPSPCHADPPGNRAYPEESCNDGHVPMKMTWPLRYYEDATTSDAKNKAIAPTDFYYADLHGNWDANGDGYFADPADPDNADDKGDFVEGGPDFSADVQVGRIPVYGSDLAKLDAILRKIVAYRKARADDIAWRKSALLAMSFTFNKHVKYVDGAPLGEQLRDDFLAPAGYATWRMYQKDDADNLCHDVSAYAALADENLVGGTRVQQRWANAPAGIVTWWGHGSEGHVVVGAEGCWHANDGNSATAADYLMASSLAPGLDDSHPAFTYQCACQNGWPETSDNLQYALLQNGAVATVAATRESWAGQVPPGHFNGTARNTGIGYEYLSRIVRNLPAGDALTQAKTAVVGWAESAMDTATKFQGFMNLLEFNLYGDPSLSLADNAGQVGHPTMGPRLLLMEQGQRQ